MEHAPSTTMLQTTPADGGANIIRSPESESPVGAASASPEVRAVVEQPVADDSPSPAGSDVFEKNRIGRFYISRELIARDPVTALRVLGHCIVVRCEMMFYRNNFEYMAFSPDFESVKEGSIAPEYEVFISDFGHKIEFKQLNQSNEG